MIGKPEQSGKPREVQDRIFEANPNDSDDQDRRARIQPQAVGHDGLHCLAMPESLHHIERFDRFATVAERERFFDEIAKRSVYTMRARGIPKPGKPQRHRCPAAARMVRCPFKPESPNLPYDRPAVYPDTGPNSDPPPCCAQATISAPTHVQGATRRKYDWGGRERFDAYTCRRQGVESFFGFIKDAGEEHATLGRIKMMGLAKTSAMVAFRAATANLRPLDAFERDEKQRAEKDYTVGVRCRHAITLTTNPGATGPSA